MCELIKFWNKLNLNPNNNKFIHPEDENTLGQVDKKCLTFDDYVKDPNNLFGDNFILHTGLIPVPYAGNISRASIYLLLINPGLHHNDYYSEYQNDEYKMSLINNLKQKNLDNDYPFLFLNPKFSHTSGGEYWINKFKAIIIKLKTEKNIDYKESLKLLAQNVCTLELFPYHSINFKLSKSVINSCPSIIKMRDFVKTLSHSNRDLYIFCLRQPTNWNLEEKNNNDNFIILPPKQRQAASLTTKTNAGQKIFDILSNKLAKK